MKNLKNHFYFKGKKAEEFVHDLALKTFLTDWCYLNPRLPNGKELCDLLIVFDSVAIIWQIKDLKLGKQGKYKISEVEKNLSQLSGARRQLFDLKTGIVLENPRRGKEKFNPNNIKEIFLLSALLGEEEDFSPLIKEFKNHTVHVFTRRFTEIILSELDTISDFTEYLRKKETCLRKIKSFTIIGGEEELLASYLFDGRNFEKFVKADFVMIDKGSWAQLKNKPEYIAKKKADEISYGWDSIIDRAHEGSVKYEKVARELARPNRFQRRYLSKVFYDAHVQAHKDNVHDLYRRVFPTKGVTYCFLFADDSGSRELRKSMLVAICLVSRAKYQENKKVIGIATEKKIEPECSYDFCILDIPKWTEENKQKVDRIQKDLGIFINPTIKTIHEQEYPQVNKIKE